MNELPYQKPSKIEGWGRRAGGFVNAKGERTIKGKSGGKGKGSNSGNDKKRFYQPGLKQIVWARKVNGQLIDRNDLNK